MSLHLILNIGLGPPSYLQAPPSNQVARCERALEFLADRGRIVNYDTTLDKLGEPVLVVECLMYEPWPGWLHDLASTVGQDAVAVWNAETGEGSLHGPCAARWEPFRRELFLTLPETRSPQ